MQHTVCVYIVSLYMSTYNMDSTIIHIRRLPARTLHHILIRTLQLKLQHALHHKTWRAQSYASGDCLHAHCITYWNAHCNSLCNTHCNTHCTTKHGEHDNTLPAIASTQAWYSTLTLIGLFYDNTILTFIKLENRPHCVVKTEWWGGYGQ